MCVTPVSRRVWLALAAAGLSAMGRPALAQSPAPLFVLNSLDNSVSVIDPASWAEVRRLATGKEPHHLYMTPDEKSVIVANAMSDSLTFVDPRTGEVQRTVQGILDPYHLRFSPDMKWFVTAANRLNHVDIYRWDGGNLALQRRIVTAKTPSHLWIDSRSTTVYVTMQDSDELVAIDLAAQTLKWRIKTGPMPADLYGLPGDRQLLVANTGGDSVEVFDISGHEPQRLRSIRTGDGAHAFRALGDGRHVLLSNRVANTVSKIDMQTLQVVGEYKVPGGPDCMDVSRDGRMLYVTSRWARRLSVVDLNSGRLLRQVKVGKSPHGVWTLDHAPR
jgi:YVTN family beta-propeller protein